MQRRTDVARMLTPANGTRRPRRSEGCSCLPQPCRGTSLVACAGPGRRAQPAHRTGLVIPPQEPRRRSVLAQRRRAGPPVADRREAGGPDGVIGVDAVCAVRWLPHRCRSRAPEPSSSTRSSIAPSPGWSVAGRRNSPPWSSRWPRSPQRIFPTGWRARAVGVAVSGSDRAPTGPLPNGSSSSTAARSKLAQAIGGSSRRSSSTSWSSRLPTYSGLETRRSTPTTVLRH